MQSFNKSDLYALARQEKEATGEMAALGASFFLTLCQVVAPVSVPESKSPALQRYRFFFTRQLDGGQTRYWLHFGYFDSELEAKRWRMVLGRIYPRATIQSESQRPSLEATASRPALTDTQVLKMFNAGATGEPAEKSVKTGLTPTRKKESLGLEASLRELRDSAWQSLELDDTAELSGVRHLKVQIETKGRLRKGSRVSRKP